MFPLKLFYKKYPGVDSHGNQLGKNFIILHGLFGSHKNWAAIAAFLQQFGDVYAVDSRNHGDSPHADSHTLTDMTGDLAEFIGDHGLERPVIIGHSMGGLVAMNYALHHPQAEIALVIVDILPLEYDFSHENELQALLVDPSVFKTRQEIDRAISTLVPDMFIRQFLMMNLTRDENGLYRWKINAGSLKSGYSFISLLPPDPVFTGKALFVMGGSSTYTRSNQDSIIKQYFPEAVISVIPGANHYLHYSSQQEFIELLSGFIPDL